MPTKSSKPAAAVASGKPASKKNAAKGAKGKKGTPADASTPPADGATSAASASEGAEGSSKPPGETGAAASQPAPPAIDPKGINPATGKNWTVKELRAEMAKNAAIIQAGGKLPQGAAVEEPPKPIVLSTRAVGDITKDWIIESAETPNGFTIREGMPVEEWAALVRSLDRQHESIGFAIGDLLNYGAKAYGKTYDEALKATGRALKTLRNWKNVAASVAPELRQPDKLSFGIHSAVAALPAPKQKEILEKAAAEDLSVRDVRKLVKKETPKKKKKPAATPPPSSTVNPHKEKLTEAEERQWEKAQEQMDAAALFVRGKIWAKLTKVDKTSVKSILKMLADAYEEIINA